jgi:hypothetical protein
MVSSSGATSGRARRPPALAGDGLPPGRPRRARAALRLDGVRSSGLPLVRRAGGGRTLGAGGGTLGVFLSVPPGVALLPPVGPDRWMNRAVRGLLAGLRHAGAKDAAYFGRDFVSSQGLRIAAVGQEGTADGGAALEALVAVERTLAVPEALVRYPAHRDPRAGGPAPGSVAAIAGGPRDAAEVGDAVARGWGEALACDLLDLDPPAAAALPEAPAPPAEEDEAGLAESGLAEVPVGFVEALVRQDGGRISLARLRGDFLAPAFVVEALERSLAGSPATFAEVGRRVDEALALPGAFVSGLDARRILADAVLEATRPAGADRP